MKRNLFLGGEGVGGRGGEETYFSTSSAETFTQHAQH